MTDLQNLSVAEAFILLNSSQTPDSELLLRLTLHSLLYQRYYNLQKDPNTHVQYLSAGPDYKKMPLNAQEQVWYYEFVAGQPPLELTKLSHYVVTHYKANFLQKQVYPALVSKQYLKPNPKGLKQARYIPGPRYSEIQNALAAVMDQGQNSFDAMVDNNPLQALQYLEDIGVCVLLMNGKIELKSLQKLERKVFNSNLDTIGYTQHYAFELLTRVFSQTYTTSKVKPSLLGKKEYYQEQQPIGNASLSSSLNAMSFFGSIFHFLGMFIQAIGGPLRILMFIINIVASLSSRSGSKTDFGFGGSDWGNSKSSGGGSSWDAS